MIGAGEVYLAVSWRGRSFVPKSVCRQFAIHQVVHYFVPKGGLARQFSFPKGLDHEEVNWRVKRETNAMALDGGFFFACEDFGRIFDHSFPACAFFLNGH